MSLKARYHKWRMNVAKKRMHSQSVPALERVQARKSFSHHSIRWYQNKEQSYLDDAPLGLDLTDLDVDPKDYRISTLPGDYETLSDEKKERIDSAIVVGEDKSVKAELVPGRAGYSHMFKDGIVMRHSQFSDSEWDEIQEEYNKSKEQN